MITSLRFAARAARKIRCTILASLAVASCCTKTLAAQGCASCYTTAAAGGSQTAHALRAGILVLLLPPVCLFAGLTYYLARWNKETKSVGDDVRTWKWKIDAVGSLADDGR